MLTRLSLTALLGFSLQGATLSGLWGNRLVHFDSANPGTSTVIPITGLLDQFIAKGLDYQPGTGTLFIGGRDNSQSYLYSVDANTGAATLVASTSAEILVGGSAWDPVTDQFRLIGYFSRREEYRWTAAGALTGPFPAPYTGGGALPPTDLEVEGLAYYQNQAYAIAVSGAVYQLPASGPATQIGQLAPGLNMGFAIDAQGNGWLTRSNPDGGGAPEQLFHYNLGTGVSTYVGNVTGVPALPWLAVRPDQVDTVPEPSTWAMLGGAVAMLALRRWRK